jgi:predicted nucleic acid-binding protein
MISLSAVPEVKEPADCDSTSVTTRERAEQMCVIIDANVAAEIFAIPVHEDYAPLWKWIEYKDGRIVYGGRNLKELARLNTVRQRLKTLWSAGRAFAEDDREVDREERAVVKMNQCRSDDPHVIALAKVSGARVLCTKDQDLQTDFKNRDLVPTPRGRVYKTAAHQHVLGHNRLCRRRTSGRPG